MGRKVWSIEEKLSIVLTMLKGEVSLSALCHRHQVSARQVYRWRDQFLEGAKEALRDGRKKKGDDSVMEENRRLKELVGSLSLIIDAQKKLLGK
jgi:transposase-like protein